jgi:hypothetical protein
VSLEAVRDAIDTCAASDPAAFARRTRNALAQAIVGEAFTHEQAAQPTHAAPLAELRLCVGDDLGGALAAVYEGSENWTSLAIDALEPLNELARPPRP